MLRSLAMRTARVRQKVSQRHLAGRAGISTKYLGNVESGAQTPSIQIVEKLADSLDISIDEYVRGERNVCIQDIKITCECEFCKLANWAKGLPIILRKE